jgi:hypothetical protein
MDDEDADEVLRTPLEDLARKLLFGTGWRQKYSAYSTEELKERTGQTWDQIGRKENDREYDVETKAIILECASTLQSVSAISILDFLEAGLVRMVGYDEQARNAVAVLTQAAFNAGFLAGSASEYSAPANLRKARGEKTLESTERNRQVALQVRRQLGEPTRQRARDLMRRRPHLSWTACANAISEGRDPRGVARVIEELFPVGVDGKRRYMGDDPQEPPALAREGP